MTVSKTLFSSQYQKWETPADLIERITAVYPIDLDLAASRPNVCDRFYSEQDDAFTQPWDGVNMWLNPPYGGGLRKWGKTVATKKVGGVLDGNLLILVPARTDTQWWKHMTWGYPTVCFIQGRLKFGSTEFWREYWAEKRRAANNRFYEGKKGMTAAEAAELYRELFKGIPTNGNPPQPAPFPSALIFHTKGDAHEGNHRPLYELMREIGQIWNKGVTWR